MISGMRLSSKSLHSVYESMVQKILSSFINDIRDEDCQVSLFTISTWYMVHKIPSSNVTDITDEAVREVFETVPIS